MFGMRYGPPIGPRRESSCPVCQLPCAAAHCGDRSEFGWKPTTATPRELCEIERYMQQALALAAESAASGQVRLAALHAMHSDAIHSDAMHSDAIHSDAMHSDAMHDSLELARYWWHPLRVAVQ